MFRSGSGRACARGFTDPAAQFRPQRRLEPLRLYHAWQWWRMQRCFPALAAQSQPCILGTRSCSRRACFSPRRRSMQHDSVDVMRWGVFLEAKGGPWCLRGERWGVSLAAMGVSVARACVCVCCLVVVSEDLMHAAYSKPFGV